MVSNLFGNLEQARYLFRDTLERVRRAIELKIDPQAFFRKPTRYLSSPWVAWTMTPKKVRGGPVVANTCRLSELPQLVSWPEDGGAFVTLPQVLSQSPDTNSLSGCNLGMYRIQLAGNDYDSDLEIGLHYQIHRGIGVHHQAALTAGKPFPVNVSVGGAPAMSVAAVMPLPEGLSELTFAGALAGHRMRMISSMSHAPIYADADFCITGTVDPTRMKPEGPFGDHLGYYSLQHEFPMIQVDKVFHRDGAVWPFTVVGRPPQEDTTFGELIHELTGPIIPTVITGVQEVNAVDAAGVHPLLLAIGSERYMPYRKPDKPAELLTQANAILGQGQLSLAKYLWIANGNDEPTLNVHDVDRFFEHVLQRVDWRRDLHFQTQTTCDTLDYSGSGFNAGSKVVIAANGAEIRSLQHSRPTDLSLPEGVTDCRVCRPGVLAIEIPARTAPTNLATAKRPFDPVCGRDSMVDSVLRQLEAYAFGNSSDNGNYATDRMAGFPLVLLTEDAEFVARSLNNFLWATFTRSDPASDTYGIRSWTISKHWGCDSSLVIDIRRKEHHAPPLIESAEVTRRVDALAARNKPISKYL
jgi:4-hydroxy-3-polyprenylbenzoate decarboxylase